MTPTETVTLVRVVRSVWPSMKLDDRTPDAWSLIFDDVPLDAALSAVRMLSKTRTGYITPADIRRQVAVDAGLIPPTSEAEGLATAAAVAGSQGAGASKLDPVTYAAYRAMGGPTAFGEKQSILRPQWARVWADVVRQHDDRVLGGDIAAQIGQRRAIAGVPAAAPALEPAPVVTDKSEETKQLIAALAKKLPQTGPEVLHDRETRWKRVQRAFSRKPEPNPHYRPEIAAAARRAAARDES